jgi:exodeoxyribonuclease V alpha subunit
MKPQKGGYPDAFEFSSFEPLCDRSTGGIESYIRKHILGIGVIKARAIVEAFGLETLDILRLDPFKVMTVSGLNEGHVEAIRVHFADTKSLDPIACAKLTEMFAGHRFPKKLVEHCVKAWGSSAPEVVRDNPYILIGFPRVGWKLVDALAIGELGYPEDGLTRHRAAIVESLSQLGNDGHTAATRSELMTGAEGLLGGRLHAEAFQKSIDDGNVVIATDGVGVAYQVAGLAHAEETIAERLKVLRGMGPSPIIHSMEFDSWEEGHNLGFDQLAAATLVVEEPISIITGPPGTGKSHLVSRLIKRFIERGFMSIRCCAPTGKAAKRMAELLMEVGITDIPCTTIHKALEVGPPEQDEEGVPKDDAKFGRGREGWSFKRHIANPLSERIIIVEEPSMLDAKLGASLLLAIAPGTRVIFVGDCNQLPSVGPGSVLRDMVEGGIPTATLTEIRRSDICGTVVHACHAIINDRIPCHADKVDLPQDNWIHIEVDDPYEIAAEIVKLNTSIKTFDRVWGVQVISPQKAKLAFGCDNLNSLLSKALNPENHSVNLLTDPWTGEMIEVSDDDFRIGDKVVRTKNASVDELIELPAIGGRSDLNWQERRWEARECPVVNGDMGTVIDILTDSRSCAIVRFRDPERLCRLSLSESHIIPAYAMTVHKMQGSGSPCVIMPVHNAFYYDTKSGRGLWNRELLYTAISRTEQLLVTVGNWAAVETAVGRKTVNRRRTTLSARMQGLTIPQESSDGIPQSIPDSDSGWSFD